MFAGQELSAEGIAPQKSRVEAIQNMKAPSNATEEQSIREMVNFCNKYIKDYSTIPAPLQLGTKNRQRFFWGTAQQDPFETLKKRFTSVEVMAFYNPDAETEFIIDGSPIGLGAILAQKQDDDNFRPVAYGSNAFCPVQQQYSPTEREALAVLWSCQHFHHYMYDRHVSIITDHRPLPQIFSSKSQLPPRIQRWMLCLQPYDFEMKYITGCEMASDYLSRNPQNQISTDDTAEHFISIIVSDAVPKACTLKELISATKSDETLQHVVSC